MSVVAGVRPKEGATWIKSPKEFAKVSDCKTYIASQIEKVTAWLEADYEIAILRNNEILYSMDKKTKEFIIPSYREKGIRRLEPLPGKPAFVTSIRTRVHPARRISPPPLKKFFKPAPSDCMKNQNWRQPS